MTASPSAVFESVVMSIRILNRTYVSVRFEQFEVEELPPFVDTEGREWKSANDLLVHAGNDAEQRPV